MSFGFSTGDFITVFQLANKIRKEFAGAPDQFKGISDEVRSLSIVIQDVDVVLSEREPNSKETTDLEAIAHACKCVLEELEKALDKYRDLGSKQTGIEKRLKQAWKRLSWEPEDIRDFRSRISSNIAMLNMFLGRLTRDNISQLVQHQENKTHDEILQWVTPIDYGPQQSDYISRRQAGTGLWLLESPEYQAWLQTGKQTLFCPGIPGAGKTILTSIVVDTLTTYCGTQDTVGIAYIYFNFRSQDTQTIDHLLASLLKQLSQGSLSRLEASRSLYKKHKDGQTRPSLDEISKALHSVVLMFSRVFVVVDALDECQTSGECRRKFLEEIFVLQTKGEVNIFATSRFIPDITAIFKASPSLEIRANPEDIQRYVDSHTSQLPSFVRNNLDLQKEIKSAIIQVVDGMFLLAKLHLDSLIGKKSPKALRTSLKRLPNGPMAYSQAYEEAMERIKGQVPDQEELAIQVLSWITYARRPLTTVELQHALAVEIDSSDLDEENLSQIEDIVSVCAGLVTVDEESGIIRLAHYTTQQYFEETKGKWFPTAGAYITEVCATYLSFDVFKSGRCSTAKRFEERLRLNPLFSYAAQNWGHYAREPLNYCAKVLWFLNCQKRVDASSQALWAVKQWSSHWNYIEEVPEDITGQHLVGYFGIEMAVEPLGNVDWRVEDSSGRTALSYAAEQGHEVVVRQLLEKGADIEAEDRHFRTVLSYAAEGGHEAVVRQLLEKGADIEARNNPIRTVLSFAAEQGHEAVIQQLLEKGADINATCLEGRTALTYAAERGHAAVVQQLLENGADIGAKLGSKNQTALSFAAEEGHEAVVRQLLEKGADIEAKDANSRTALIFAAEKGHEAAVRQLLEKGADIEAKDANSRTALIFAAEKGHEATVRHLLEKGADIEVKGGWDALNRLIHGAQPEHSQTALGYAAYRGHEAVVRQLLEKGADIEAKDSNNQTALSVAAEQGHEVVVRQLLEKGADIEAKGSNGWTALIYAAERGFRPRLFVFQPKRGNEAVVRQLLEKGADIEAKSSSGRTALIYAAKQGHEAIVRELLEKGADIEAKGVNGGTALSYAAEKGREAVVRQLLEKGADMEAKDSDDRTALSYAAEEGHEAVVRQLLEKGADIEAKDSDDRTALSYAAEQGHEAVVRQLLEKGADIKANGGSGRTALNYAIEHGHDAVVRQLTRG